MAHDRFSPPARYVAQVLMSIYHDLDVGGPGMNRAADLLETDSYMASKMANAFSDSTLFLDKPLIRCQNCTKTPEEVGKNANFMVCSNCKSKLNFLIHYCSKYVCLVLSCLEVWILPCISPGRARRRTGTRTRNIAGRRKLRRGSLAPSTTRTGNIPFPTACVP